jgi:hypothetical protein
MREKCSAEGLGSVWETLFLIYDVFLLLVMYIRFFYPAMIVIEVWHAALVDPHGIRSYSGDLIRKKT